MSPYVSIGVLFVTCLLYALRIMRVERLLREARARERAVLETALAALRDIDRFAPWRSHAERAAREAIGKLVVLVRP